jgi:hypothetical protein
MAEAVKGQDGAENWNPVSELQRLYRRGRKLLPLRRIAAWLGEDVDAVKSWSKRGYIPEAKWSTVAEKLKCSEEWLENGVGIPPDLALKRPIWRQAGAKEGPLRPAMSRSVADLPRMPYARETLSTGDSGDLPHASEEAENLSPGAARSSMKGASTALRKPPSVEMIADRAAELVGQLAQRLYDKDPRLLREWLIRLAVDTPPELVPEVDALISLAREARWRWKADDAEEVGNTGSAKDDSTE